MDALTVFVKDFYNKNYTVYSNVRFDFFKKKIKLFVDNNVEVIVRDYYNISMLLSFIG